jgi:peptidoglycan/LPS O-acetylase OafA/YrhL
MTSTKQPQLLPLTGIRFFLALWVVIFHQPFFRGIRWLSHFLDPFPIIIRTGFLAVGVFFMLSGFVLSYNYPLGTGWPWKNVVTFGIARFARIYPAYGVGLLLMAPFVVDPPLRPLGKALAVASLNWTLMQAWVPRTAVTWNYPGWSLSAELFFYCCFPFLGVALWKLSRPSSLFIAGLLLWVGSAMVPLLAILVPLTGPLPVTLLTDAPMADRFWFNVITYNPLLHLPQFCMGIIIGRTHHLLHNKNSSLLKRGYCLYVPGMILEMIALSFYKSHGGNFFVLNNGLLLPLHSLIILGFSLGGGILARFLSVRPLVFLGNASYSLYILHIPVSRWMGYIGRRVFSTNLEGFGATAFYIVVVVCLSSMCFKLIEEPANRIIKNLLVSRFDLLRERSTTTVP